MISHACLNSVGRRGFRTAEHTGTLTLANPEALALLLRAAETGLRVRLGRHRRSFPSLNGNCRSRICGPSLGGRLTPWPAPSVKRAGWMAANT